MIRRVCGCSGSGKTEYMLGIIGDVISSGGQCVVIVPEQQSLDYERTVFGRYGSTANMNCEILNFERLPNRTYREYGGLSAEYIDDGGRDIVMANVLLDVKDKLSEYRSVCEDADFVRSAVSAVSAVKANGIDTAKLLTASEELGGRLGGKLRDIYTIVNGYEKSFCGGLSDSFDALSVYAKKLRDMPFFRGKTVIIDSFYTFTGQEYAIIDEIAAQTDVYISFVYEPDMPAGEYGETEKAYLRVSLRNRTADILMPQNRRAVSPELAFASENIWAPGSIKYEGKNSSVSFVECSSPFDECEAAAAEAVRYLKSGMRMRDILMIARNTDDYDGMIDTALAKHGLYAFMSDKEKLSQKSLTTFLLMSAGMAADNFSLQSVRKYIKSGYTGLTERESSLLLRYITTWNIHGGEWFLEGGWSMNPGGYAEVMTSYQKNVLAQVNSAREKVASQFSALESSLGKKEFTSAEAASALYAHMKASQADEMILSKAAALRRAGDEEGAQVQLQLWEKTINILDQLYLVGGSRKIDARRLYFLLRLAADEYTVGSIPVSSDAITVGGASMIRSCGQKAVILIGVNDGVFPASSSEKGLFGDDELIELERRGIYIEDGEKARRTQEKLFFRAAVSAASDKLSVIYNTARPSRPSFGAQRLLSIFGETNRRTFGNCFSDLTFSAKAAAENISRLSGGVVGRLGDLGLDMRDKVKQIAVADPTAKVKPMSGGSLSLSPSKLERYTYCAFSYFGRYILDISTQKKAEFGSREIGVFVHKILQVYIESNIKGGKFIRPSDEEIKSQIEAMTDDYLLSVFRGRKADARFTNLMMRLRRSVFYLLQNVSDELSVSGFVPVAFEKKLEPGKAVFKTSSGVTVELSGVADRIDEIDKDGKKYIRIIDYKTGKKKFSLEAVNNGLDLQMLVYLFAECAGISGARAAGVLYLPAVLSPAKADGEPDSESEKDQIRKSFRRSGIVIDEPEIVGEMEPGLKGAYIPVVMKKDNGFDIRYSSVASAEKFDQLNKQVGRCVEKLAESLTGGDMSVSPLKLNEIYDACHCCDYKPFCRLSGNSQVIRRGNAKEVPEDD